MTVELKPCPFCGDHSGPLEFDERQDGEVGQQDGYPWHVCGAQGSRSATREAAIAAWNTRPQSQGVDREALARIVGEAVFRTRNLRLTAHPWTHTVRAEVIADEAVDAILALLPPEGEWRDISSAPRDGTWFLACATQPGWRATRIVRFQYPDDRFPINDDGGIWPSAPTHWRPLPTPPASTAMGE